MSETISKYYLRFQVKDRPGVLGQITSSLGKNNISIEAVIQKGRQHGGGSVPVVIMTHEAKESNLVTAIKEINKFPVVKTKSFYLRIEEL